MRHVWVVTNSKMYWSDGPLGIGATRAAGKRIGAAYLTRTKQFSRIDAEGMHHLWFDFDDYSECRTDREIVYVYRYEVER